MQNILILDQSSRDRVYAARLIEKSGVDARAISVCSCQEASHILKHEVISLFIVDIPCFNLEYTQFLESIYRIAPSTQVLATSCLQDIDIANHVWRLGIKAYLLKPFRDEWLIAAVRTMLVGAPQHQKQRYEWERTQHLAAIDTGIRTFMFKKCIDTTREYLDFLYNESENPSKIGENILSFADGILDLAVSFGFNCSDGTQDFVRRFRRLLEAGKGFWEAYDFFERLLDRIFGFIERSGSFHTSEIQKILTFVDRNVKRGVSMVDVACYANMSPSYFSKFFKRETGENFITYLTDLKINYAKLMLAQTDYSISRIASELAYRDANYFGKAFKKQMGITPVEYRERSTSR